MITRRSLGKALIASAVSLAVNPHSVWATLRLGGSSVAAGMFPNAAPAFLPMRQVYPAPTGVTSTEPHQFAYFDAVNNTAHGIQWQKRIGVSFGRWPFIYELVSGPPGMAFGATYWQTAWDGHGDAAYKAGYGQLRWTPTAAISSESPTLVSVNVIDQDNNVLNIQWYIHTSGDITQSGGVHAFINADTGSDSSGNGSYATPWQTASYALGTSATSPGAAPAGSVLVPMGATATYIFPQTSTNVFTWNSTYKPAAIVGIPGSPSTWDMSSGAGTSGTTGVHVGCAADGLFAQDIILENYTDIADYILFSFTARNRITFQGLIWNNAGYGASSNNNASMVYVLGGSTNYGTYFFMTGCEENGRQAGTNPNNFSVCGLYSLEEVLVELNAAVSTNQIGSCYVMKSDIGYGCMRANLGSYAGASHGFDWLQAPYQASNNSESSYNVAVNVNNINVPETTGFTYGTLAARRNNLVSGGNGLVCAESAYNMMGCYSYANVVSGQPYGLSIAAPSINTSGGSLGANTWYYGMTTVGETGESTTTTSNGTNEVSVTTTGSTNAVTMYRLPVPGESACNIYRGTASGTYTEVAQIPAGTTSWTDTGSEVTYSGGSANWTSTSGAPSTNTAVSASRFNFDSNVVQNATQTTDPSGTAVASDGHNQYSAVLGALLNTSTGLLLISNGGKYGAQLA